MAAPEPTNKACDRRLCIHIRQAHNLAAGADLDKAIANAQLVYGAHGIRIDVCSMQSIGLSGAELAQLAPLYTDCVLGTSSRLESSLYMRFGVRHDRSVTVFIIDSIWTAFTELLGCGAHRSDQPSLMLGSRLSPWTFAHELGHVLNGQSFAPPHVEQQGNLMWALAGSYTQTDKPFLDGFAAQWMRNSPLLLPC